MRLQVYSWQLLAGIILRIIGDLEFDIVQEIQVLSDTGTCLKPHPQWLLLPSRFSRVRLCATP